MNRHTLIILCLTILFVGNTTLFIGNIAAATELLQNGGFDNGTPGNPYYWGKYYLGIQTPYSYPESGMSGKIGDNSAAINFTIPDKIPADWIQNVNSVNSTNNYTLSGYLQTSNINGGGIKIYADWYTSTGAYIRSSNPISFQGIGTIGWTYFTKQLAVPSNAASVHVVLQMINATGKVWFDNMSFWLGNPPPPPPIQIGSNNCDPTLWSHVWGENVYLTSRLMLNTSYSYNGCIYISGTIDNIKPEYDDGDYHISIRPDPQYSILLNQNNTNNPENPGDLVAEVICANYAKSNENECNNFNQSYLLKNLNVGNHITMTGEYVQDLNNTYQWMEIHPITSIGPAVLSLSADKSNYSKIGDVITYTYKIVNSGNMALNGFNVTDNVTGTFLCGDAPANGSVQCTKSYAITQNDINNGYVTNVVYVSTVSNGIIDNSNINSMTINYIPPNPPPRINLLQNGGFENGTPGNPDYWGKYYLGIQTPYSYPEPGVTGNIGDYSAAINFSLADIIPADWLQGVTGIIPTTSYQLSGYLQTSNISGGAVKIYADWYDTNGSYISSSNPFWYQGTNGWIYVSKNITSPAIASSTHIVLQVVNTTGKAWFDDISFSKN